MNNEPVAWMVAEMVFTIEESAVAMAKVYEDEIIPLYTHPAKPTKVKFASDSCESGWIYLDYEEPAKTLTDEEISEVWDKMCSIVLDNDKNITAFARAILRKAQEK